MEVQVKHMTVVPERMEETYRSTVQEESKIKEEATMEIRKDFDLNDIKNTTNQNLWDETKAVIRESYCYNC
jgi:hypothetical protein